MENLTLLNRERFIFIYSNEHWINCFQKYVRQMYQPKPKICVPHEIKPYFTALGLFPAGLFPVVFSPPVFSPLGLFHAGFFPNGFSPPIFIFRVMNKKNEVGNSLNAVEREPVLTRVLNPNASEASYKPKQRSYRKTKLKKTLQ